jgi:SDR family mycofactocin-dependent oxidoreductase
MGSLSGKVALITGAARGQGRSHAIRLADDGADIIAIDIAKNMDSVPYDLATQEDLADTAREIERRGGRVLARTGDVRDFGALQTIAAEGHSELGSIDIVVANAGIAPFSASDDPRRWEDVLDVNLTGVYYTVESALPFMREGDRGGSIVIISSTAGLTGHSMGSAAGLSYTASKHGVVGLMRSYANVLAPVSIRVNSVHPTGVRTPMVENEAMAGFLVRADIERGRPLTNALPVDMVETVDVTEAVAYLVSDRARYVTGIELPVDAGYCVRN